MTFTLLPTICCSCLCPSRGVEEFCGYCADCWKDLEPEERATLRGEEPAVKEVIHHKHVETHYPPRPWWGWRVAYGAFRCAEAGAVAWLVLRAVR
jgi:hypothetical protein